MRLKVARIEVRPHLVLVDADGKICDEVIANSFFMYPGKFIEFSALCVRVEEEANMQVDKVRELMDRPVLENGNGKT